jgi:hypothetical protein
VTTSPTIVPKRVALDKLGARVYWPRYAVAGGAMYHVNVYFLYSLAVTLYELQAALEQNRHLYAGYSASHRAGTLRLLLHGDFVPLDGADQADLKRTATQLLHVLSELAEYGDPSSGKMNQLAPERTRIPGALQHRYVDALERFSSRLDHDSGRLSLYFVPQRLAYNTQTLLDNAERAFVCPHVLPDEAVADIKEAGRCLAYGLPTACAFHVLRAAEAVMRMYLWLLGGTLPDTSEWAPLIDAIGVTKKAPKHLVARLHRLRDLERNQLMHVTLRPLLTPSEGAEVFEYAKDAINAMTLHIDRMMTEVRGART